MIYTPEFLGLPQEVIDILKNRVITAQTIRTPQLFDTWVRTGGIPAMRRETRVRQSTRTSNLNGYALNWMHSQVHDSDFVYIGEQSGSHVFRKEAVHFSLYGTEYYIPAQNIFVSAEGKIDVSIERTTYSYASNRQRVELTSDEVATLAGVSVETLYDWDIDTYTTQERNTSTHICNGFVKVETMLEGLVPTLYINGEQVHPSQYGNFTTMQGTRTSLRLNAVVYNDCTAETADASAGFEAGNFGACSIVKGITSFPFAVEFDATKEHAVVEFRYCELTGAGNETGKEWRWHGYFNLKTGEQIPALIRKPHPDAVFF
jgi:hypothetical protein